MDHSFPHLFSQIITPDNSCETSEHLGEGSQNKAVVCVFQQCITAHLQHRCGWDWKSRVILCQPKIGEAVWLESSWTPAWGGVSEHTEIIQQQPVLQKQLLLTTSPVLRAANGQMKLCSQPWRCIKSAWVPVMPGLWSSFPMSWQKEAGSLQGAWLDSDQCGLTTDSSQDPTSSHVGKGRTTVKLPLDT